MVLWSQEIKEIGRVDSKPEGPRIGGGIISMAITTITISHGEGHSKVKEWFLAASEDSQKLTKIFILS